MSRHAVIKLKLRAVIGGYAFDDVVQYTSAFAMNSIPVASIGVAVGRNVNTNRRATIHSALDDLKVQQKAEVFLRAEISSEEEQPVLGVPNGVEIKIFEGDVVGTGWKRTESGAAFIIHILHWIGNLNYSSAISASSHPGNPADLTYPAIFQILGGSNTDPKSASPGFVPWISSSIVNENSFSDIWGNVLHKWMLSLANEDPFDVAILGGNGGGGDANTIAALNRMAPGAPGVPLELALEGSNRDVIATGIKQALVNETGGNFTNTTLWGKLIGEWAPAYWFSVIPLVEKALVVPFTGGLQGEPWAVIGADDYNQADLNAQLHQVLRGVGIIHPTMFFSGLDNDKGAIALDRGGFAGWYQPPGLDRGMVLIKDAPKWLSDPITPHVYGASAEGVNGQTVSTALDPVNAGQARQPSRDFAQVQNDFKDVMSLYAKQWFVIESLKGRVGELAGKLRFDIAPGSNVLVKAGGSRNIEESFAIEEDIYATVTQVTCVINAESQRAGTAFSLDHIRSLQENSAEGTSIARPPLYTTPWRGATLVQSTAVRPET
jgi:hypothetical protein